MTTTLHPSDGEEDEGVDLHSGEFCVDVSTFGDIVFENQGREACDTTFEKVCETKTEQVSQVERRFCGTTLFCLATSPCSLDSWHSTE